VWKKHAREISNSASMRRPNPRATATSAPECVGRSGTNQIADSGGHRAGPVNPARYIVRWQDTRWATALTVSLSPYECISQT
jgi:hypothetical protein